MEVKQYTCNGKTQSLTEWANEIGVNRRVLAKRLLRMPPERAFVKELPKKKKAEHKKRTRPKSPGRTAAVYEYKGEKHTLTEWAVKKGWSKNVIRNRIAGGMTFEEAIERDLYFTGRKFEYKGELYTLRQLTKLSPIGLSKEQIRSRLMVGWDVERAITQPIKERSKNENPIYEDYFSSTRCSRYDCYHQEGDGKCKLGHKNKEGCTDYLDAYKVYYGKEKELKEDGYQYYGSGCTYVCNSKKRTQEEKDPWEKDRRLLCYGYLPDDADCIDT